jgi:hypothetical protein
MSNTLTALKLWYNRLTSVARTKFKETICNECGIDDSTFYRHLSKEPPKLIKEKFAEKTGLDINDLYRTA